jgi:glycine/D-amino acid oxidase-like deaminating enzyme
MIIDARSIAMNDIVNADVCIVGAGAAGITTALELSGHSARVVLMEGGGLTATKDPQEAYAGATIGRRYH